MTSGQLQSQSWLKRVEVRFHLAMCSMCSRLACQLEQVRAAAKLLRGQYEADDELETPLLQRLTRRQ